MSHWEAAGMSNEWYTPKYIFDAMDVIFHLDPAHPDRDTHVRCGDYYSHSGLERDWKNCFVWLNPPFGGRNGIQPWLDKFFANGNGVALTPDRTSAPWWQDAAKKADAVLFVAGKVKFERPDGSIGKSPSTGTTLFASGGLGLEALLNASDAGLGFLSIDREEAVRNLLEIIEGRGYGIDDRDNGLPLGTIGAAA